MPESKARFFIARRFSPDCYQVYDALGETLCYQTEGTGPGKYEEAYGVMLTLIEKEEAGNG